MFRNLKRSDAAILAIGVFVGLTLLLTCAGALGASMASAAGNPVPLSAATSDPDYLRALDAGASVTKTRQCGRHGHFTEFSAYNARGGALGGQRWTDGPFPYAWWPDARGGYVSFDGLTFTNHTRHTVLVGAWCS